eukprot:7385343-Prymnesium_polylepis.2
MTEQCSPLANARLISRSREISSSLWLLDAVSRQMTPSKPRCRSAAARATQVFGPDRSQVMQAAGANGALKEGIDLLGVRPERTKILRRQTQELLKE